MNERYIPNPADHDGNRPARDTGFRVHHRAAPIAHKPAAPSWRAVQMIDHLSGYVIRRKKAPDAFYRETYLAIRAAIVSELGGAHV